MKPKLIINYILKKKKLHAYYNNNNKKKKQSNERNFSILLFVFKF